MVWAGGSPREDEGGRSSRKKLLARSVFGCACREVGERAGGLKGRHHSAQGVQGCTWRGGVRGSAFACEAAPQAPPATPGLSHPLLPQPACIPHCSLHTYSTVHGPPPATQGPCFASASVWALPRPFPSPPLRPPPGIACRPRRWRSASSHCSMPAWRPMGAQ